jgi:integrase
MKQKQQQRHQKTTQLFLEDQEEFRLLINSIKSEETKKSYVTCIKRYMEMQGINNLLSDNNPRLIENQIIDFVIKMKKQGKGFYAIHNYLTALISFYKINDIMINTTKIKKFQPDLIRKKDRGYRTEEISKLLEFSDERMRAVILLLSATGMRIGAIETLRLRNLERLDNNISKVTIYEGSNYEYICYVTPEATNAIDNYLDMRKRYGEILNPNSLLIREQFDIRDSLVINKPKMASSHSLQRKLIDLGIRSGIRPKQVLDKEKGVKSASLRTGLSVCHGFRKRFSNILIEAGIMTEHRWLLEGHNLRGNDNYYVRISEKKLLEEYEKAIDNLTINEENRLRKKVEMLEIEKSKVDRIELKLQLLEKEFIKKRKR